LNPLKLIKSYSTPILFASGSIVKSVVQLFAGFVTARFVAPNDLGLWNSIGLLMTYSVFLQGGLLNGLNLELPGALGRGDIEKAKKIAGSALTITFLTAIISVVLGFIYFLFTNEPNPQFKYGILAVSILISLGYYQSYLTSTFRSKSSFKNLSFIQLIEGLTNLATIVLVIYFFYYGMIAKALIATFISVACLHFLRPLKVNLLFDKVELFNIYKVGLPIFGLVCLESFTSTIDRLWLIKYSSMTDVGLYSFSMYSMTLFTIFSSSIATYIYPRMTYNYGQNNDKAALWKYVKKITLILVLGQIPLVIIGYFAVPFGLSNIFPKYLACIVPMQILLIAGYFKGCVVGANVLWSIKSWRHMIIYQLFYSAFLILFTFLGWYFFKDKLIGISIGVLIANLMNLISGITLSYYATNTIPK
jgi:O-antigen/teichoic acid export membrane protein